MNISCEPVKMSCIKYPTASDISHLKAAEIAPNSLIDKVFSGLASDYKALKKSSPSISKTNISKTNISKTNISKTNKSETNKSKTNKSKTNKSKTKTRGGRKRQQTRRRSMRGGALSEFQKNRIADIVILLVAGSAVAAGSYWSVATALETYIVSIGLLPKLCGQSIFEHTLSNFASTFGSESCVARTQRYNTIVTGVVAAITTAGWFNREMFSKAGLTKNYAKVHKNVKRTLFASEGPFTPSPSQTNKRSASRSRSPPQ
jgi:hypothetical protein